MSVQDQVNEIIDVVTSVIGVEDLDVEDIQKTLYVEILKILTPPTLDDYGLMVGQEVKFVPPNSTNKRNGRVQGINADGSIYIRDDKKAFGRSIPVGDLYIEVKGPRGGTVVKKVVDK